MKKNAKPLRRSLPGAFGQMTREQMDGEARLYDAEFSGINAQRAVSSRTHPKKRGRPAKPFAEKAARVLITIEPRLLAAADDAADKKGLTRAALISEAVSDWLRHSGDKRRIA